MLVLGLRELLCVALAPPTRATRDTVTNYHYIGLCVLYHYYHTNTLYSVGWLYNIRPTLFIQLTENQQKTGTAMHIA